MAELLAPDPRFQRSFLEVAAEFWAHGYEPHAGLTLLRPAAGFPGEAYTPEALLDPEVFATYVDRLVALGDPATPLPDGIVPATYLWWVSGDEFLGRLSIRHSLTPWLLDFGGHIGYAVRPSARRQGHATAMLGASLGAAAELGIEQALVTCDTSNVASRRVIEANGGVLEDKRGVKLRYWLPTG